MRRVFYAYKCVHFSGGHSRIFNKPAMASKSLKRKWRFGGSLNKIYLYGAQEWNVNWINKTGDEK